MPVLQAGMIEEDLTAYLLARYRQLEKPGLVRLIEQRKVASAGQPFEAWIAGLDLAQLTLEERAGIEMDLRIFLESLSGQGRRTIGICT